MGQLNTQELSTFYPATVEKIIPESSQTVTVVFSRTDGRKLKNLAGQYLLVRFLFGKTHYLRAYSLISLDDEDSMRFTAKAVMEGRMSNYIVNDLKAGDKFEVSNPRGDFTLPVRIKSRYKFLMVAGGAGITPIYALLKSIAQGPVFPHVSLVVYNRQEKDVIFGQQLKELDAAHDWLNVHFCFTREEAPAHGLAGDIDLAQFVDKGNPANGRVFLCGSARLLDRSKEELLELGVPPENLKEELFAEVATQGERPPGGQKITLIETGIFARKRHIYSRQGESLLQACRRSGVRLAHSCTFGYCGQCKVKLLKGQVAMDEPNCLKPKDAQQDLILSCVAYPTERIVIKVRRS